MLKSVEGIFRNGKVELLEPAPTAEEAAVLVTFLPTGKVDLRQHGIDEQQAANLRGRLKTFQEEWDRPEMDIYDEL
jgi:hypothetical protein